MHGFACICDRCSGADYDPGEGALIECSHCGESFLADREHDLYCNVCCGLPVRDSCGERFDGDEDAQYCEGCAEDIQWLSSMTSCVKFL